MVSNLFIKLNQINSEIDQSIYKFNLEQVNDLDERYTKIWDEIYSYQPMTHDDSKTMVLHLLNELADCAEGGKDFKNIRMKILELFSQQTWYQEPVRAYGT